MASGFLRGVSGGRVLARRIRAIVSADRDGAGGPAAEGAGSDSAPERGSGAISRFRQRLIDGPLPRANRAKGGKAPAEPPPHHASITPAPIVREREVAGARVTGRSPGAEAEGQRAFRDVPPQRLRTERLLRVSVADAPVEEVARRIVAWSMRPPVRTLALLDLALADAARGDPLLARALREADVVLPAGRGVSLLATLEGTPLAGSATSGGVLEALARAAAAGGRSVFLVGQGMEELHHAARRLAANHRGLVPAGAYAVPRGFERDPACHAELLAIVRTVRPDVVLVALPPAAGAVWAQGMAGAVRRGVFVTLAADALAAWERARTAGQRPPVERLSQGATGLIVSLGRLPQVSRLALRLPGLLRCHRKDRVSHHALERRRALARISDERYREMRASSGEDAGDSSDIDGNDGSS